MIRILINLLLFARLLFSPNKPHDLHCHCHHHRDRHHHHHQPNCHRTAVEHIFSFFALSIGHFGTLTNPVQAIAN